MHIRLSLLACVSLFAIAMPAFAQRTDNNAVASAEDAFGKTVVGDVQIGIYNPDDVRGFSPVSAGNLRLEGLYFDQQSNITDRLIEGSTVHVGISAQGYPFPAPTGIADYSLRKPGDKFVTSIGLNYGPWYGKSAEVDLQIPLQGDRLGLIAGAGLYREGNPWGGSPHTESYAVSLRYAPIPQFSIQPFWSQINFRNDESQPLIFTSGNFLPTRIPRNRFLGQKWADSQARLNTIGVVSQGKAAGFDLAVGIFRSTFSGAMDHTDLLFNVDPSGAAGDRVVIADKGNFFGSTSGEFKLSRNFIEGPRRHTIHATIRGRSLSRRYGGSDIIDLGPSSTLVPDFRAAPIEAFGAKTRDHVKQTTFGLGYEMRWRDVGELNLGLQKTNYSKQVDDPASVIPETKDSPYLFSATAAVHIVKNIALYAGYTRGLEESDVAPANAVNRNEAPPAIRTQQKDFGLRWTISPGVSAVLGYFDVRKPYYNLDTASRFRQLGDVRKRGLEFSISGQIAPGVNLVVGSVYLDAKVSGEEVDLGLIGERPVGTFKLHNVANLNWNLPWHKPLTLTARFESTSNRTANAANTLVIPARSVTSLGARYRLTVGNKPILIRGTVDNIFNKFGWNAGGSGFFVPNGSRRYSLTLATDL
ncbi:TonB-dependent receptor [Aquisediminimonas profunda]|uniref:TonB-dependent receptor n=1 Tax=Aquisediminimonas profunda TaxID=1550733 RepID=UPI001C62D905|nr:TonB-dependent receptor [Aquisediminimonas profunda]